MSISRVMGIVGIGVVGVLTCLTVADVLGRYLFRRPVLGTTELTEYMMTVIVFLALAWCAVKKRHIMVDIIITRLAPRVRAVLSSITYTLTLGVLVIITWQCTLESIATQQSPKASAILNIRAYPFYWIMAAGFAVLCLVVLVQVVQNVAKAVKK